MTKKQKRKHQHRRQARRHQKQGTKMLLAVSKPPRQKPSIPARFLARIQDERIRVRDRFPRKKVYRHRIPWLWDAPFTCWSNGHCVRIWIGEKVLHLGGKTHGRTFEVPIRNLYHWGIGSGPWLSKKEQVELSHLIQEKTAANPFLRVVFV